MKFFYIVVFTAAALGAPAAGLARAFDPRVDSPSKLSRGASIERNMAEISRTNSAIRKKELWSDRTWDHNRALLGERYTDRRFVNLPENWAIRKSYNAQYSAEKALALPLGHPNQRSWLAVLSPAEKYDVLMGTVRGGLYDRMVSSLDSEMGVDGRVPKWWGICEGSAAAAVASAEAIKSVIVRSEAYGVDVPFYATDIKGLLALLWSSYNRSLRLPEIGQQCRRLAGAEVPQAALETASCFDVNPGSFHVALHYFIGLGNGGLIADIDPEASVDNYPLLDYETKFFRPGKRSSPSSDFRSSLLPISKALQDPRLKFRSPGTAYLLGVSTTLVYGKNDLTVPLEGTRPRIERTLNLIYELELDASLNVLGGEWLTKRHPDILWTVPWAESPSTAGDAMLGAAPWRSDYAPANWALAAREAAKGMMPLKKIVDGLVRQSSN